MQDPAAKNNWLSDGVLRCGAQNDDRPRSKATARIVEGLVMSMKSASKLIGPEINQEASSRLALHVLCIVTQGSPIEDIRHSQFLSTHTLPGNNLITNTAFFIRATLEASQILALSKHFCLGL